MSRTRYPFLDLIRVTACFLVIILHVAAINFPQFSETWLVTVCWDGVSRMCVPLFFMITGFLLLDRPVSSLGKFYLKRYARILIPFAAVCAFYYFTPEYEEFDFFNYLIQISIVKFADYHLWYVYALIPVYLALPFFAKIFTGGHASKFITAYMIIWAALCVFANTAVRYLMPQLSDNFLIFITNLYYFYIIMGYMVFAYMGYMLCGVLIKRTCAAYGRKILICTWLLFIASSAAIIYATWSYSHALGKPNELFFENLTPFVACQTVSFFMLCTYARAECAWMRSLADKTYWIYLLHLLWLRVLLALLPLPADSSLTLAIPAIATLIFIMAWLTAIPLRALELWLLRLCRIGINGM